MCLKQGNAHHKLIMIKVLSWTDAALYYTVRYLVLYINFRKGVIKTNGKCQNTPNYQLRKCNSDLL